MEYKVRNHHPIPLDYVADQSVHVTMQISAISNLEETIEELVTDEDKIITEEEGTR